MKRLIILLLCFSYTAQAQESVFAPYFGEWVGALQYLDYSSNDTVTISATVTVRPVPGKPWQAIFDYDYPKEPNHQHSDTLTYYGPLLRAGADGLEWRQAEPGNDAGKSAILLRNFRFRTGELRLWKEVQWNSKPGFFLRNQYMFRRKVY